MERIMFANKKNLELFFIDIKKTSKLSWSKIARYITTTRSMLDNYRKGKTLLPRERFDKLLIFLDNSKRNRYIELASKKDGNWGQIKGGQNAYKVNKKHFDLGRTNANKNRGVKYEFDINMPLSEDLCEFVGVIIGDGFTNKYNNIYQTQITGDKILDLDYYKYNLREICIKNFKIDPTIKVASGGLRLNLYSKRVFELLTKRFKIPAGVKSYSVKIPVEILKANPHMLRATLRGMFNTDGGVGLDKRKIYKEPYIRVNYTSASFTLIDQIHLALNKFDVAHSIYTKNDTRAKQIQINGVKNVKQFIKHIGFSNPRHTIKLEHIS